MIKFEFMLFFLLFLRSFIFFGDDVAFLLFWVFFSQEQDFQRINVLQNKYTIIVDLGAAILLTKMLHKLIENAILGVFCLFIYKY